MTPQFQENLIEIFNCLPDATFAIDIQGRVVAWNHGMEVLTGVPGDAVIGKGNHEYALPFYGVRKLMLIDLVFKSDAEIEKKYRYIYRTDSVVIGETEAAKLKGQNVYLWGKAAAIRDHTGEVVGAIESIRNITLIKQTEEALRRSEQQLKEQKTALEQKNIDLKDILGQVEEEKKRIQEDVTSNVDNVLVPIIKKMQLKGDSKKYVRVLQENLEDLVSSFGRRITEKKYRLTPREIEISTMIRNGMTGKEISKLLNLSFQTVEMHRKNIRRKLGLANKKVNLVSYLKDFS